MKNLSKNNLLGLSLCVSILAIGCGGESMADLDSNSAALSQAGGDVSGQAQGCFTCENTYIESATFTGGTNRFSSGEEISVDVQGTFTHTEYGNDWLPEYGKHTVTLRLFEQNGTQIHGLAVAETAEGLTCREQAYDTTVVFEDPGLDPGCYYATVCVGPF